MPRTAVRKQSAVLESRNELIARKIKAGIKLTPSERRTARVWGFMLNESD